MTKRYIYITLDLVNYKFISITNPKRHKKKMIINKEKHKQFVSQIDDAYALCVVLKNYTNKYKDESEVIYNVDYILKHMEKTIGNCIVLLNNNDFT